MPSGSSVIPVNVDSNNSGKTSKSGNSVDCADIAYWPTLIPIESNNNNLPSVDPCWLPAWAGEFASALANETETPPELSVSMILGVVSAACARCTKVQIHENYCEVCNLWIAVALSPGNAKSPVESRCGAPLRKYESEQAELRKAEIIARRSEIATQEQRVKSLRQKAANAKSQDDYEHFKRCAAEAEQDVPEEITELRLWTSDVTPERLGSLLSDNHGCIAWLSAEAGIFDLLQGRYSGGIQNLDLFLKSYSGDSERVDRGSRPSIALSLPRLTMCLTPQPEAMKGLAGVKGFRGRGLLGRFIFFVPRSNLGYRSLDTTPVPESLIHKYDRGIGENLAWYQKEIMPVRLSKKALEAWQQYRTDLEPTMRPGGHLYGITDWAAKSAGTAARVANALHAIDCSDMGCVPWEREISAEHMTCALNLISVAREHAIYAFQLMGSDESTNHASKALDWITIKNQRKSFTARELFSALQRTFNKMSACHEALNDLQDRGYIRQCEQTSTGPGRKPSPTYQVRPENV